MRYAEIEKQSRIQNLTALWFKWNGSKQFKFAIFCKTDR